MGNGYGIHPDSNPVTGATAQRLPGSGSDDSAYNKRMAKLRARRLTEQKIREAEAAAAAAAKSGGSGSSIAGVGAAIDRVTGSGSGGSAGSSSDDSEGGRPKQSNKPTTGVGTPGGTSAPFERDQGVGHNRYVTHKQVMENLRNQRDNQPFNRDQGVGHNRGITHQEFMENLRRNQGNRPFERDQGVGHNRGITHQEFMENLRRNQGNRPFERDQGVGHNPDITNEEFMRNYRNPRPNEGGAQAGGASVAELQRQLEQRQMMEAEAKAISDKLNSMSGPAAPPPTPYGGKGFGGTAPAGGGDPGGMNMGEQELLEAAMAEGVIDPAEVTENNKGEWLNWLLMALNPQMGFLNLGWKAMGGWDGIKNSEYPFSPEYKALQEQREADRQAADDREAIRNRGLNYGAQVNQLPTDEAGQPVELTPEQELEQLLGGITDDAFLKYFNGAFGHLGTEDQLRILKGLLEARGETPAAANIEDLLSNTPDRPAIQPLRKYGTSASDWKPDRRGQSNVSGA